MLGPIWLPGEWFPRKDSQFSWGRKGQCRCIPSVFCRTVGCFTKATSPSSTRHLHREGQVSKGDPQRWERAAPRRNPWELPPTRPGNWAHLTWPAYSTHTAVMSAVPGNFRRNVIEKEICLFRFHCRYPLLASLNSDWLLHGRCLCSINRAIQR